MMPDLLRVRNVISVPHGTSISPETRLRMTMMATENLIAGLNGKRPPNLVNEEVLSS